MKGSEMTVATREDRLLELIEDAIFEAEDDVILEAGGAQELAARARCVVQAAGTRVRSQPVRQSVTRRRDRRAYPKVALPQRQALQRLLVANPRARELAGLSDVEPLSDAEIEELSGRLAAMGLLHRSDEDEV